MGNGLKKDTSELWTFRGRQNELNGLLDLVKVKRMITITGLMKIGKSRLMVELYNELIGRGYSLMYYDFQNDDPEKSRFQRKWVKEMLTFFGGGKDSNDKNIEDFEKLDLHTANGLKHLIDLFGDMLNNNNNNKSDDVILFLDNIDVLLKSKLNDKFQSFLKAMTGELQLDKTLRIVISSSMKLGLTNIRLFRNVHIRKLDVGSVESILREVYESGEGGCPWEEVAGYMTRVAKLCDGLPNAAIMAGCILVEDGYLIRPQEMVELLIHFRLRCLSPDNYPAEDRLDLYKDQLDSGNIGALHCYLTKLVVEVNEFEFTEEVALRASGENQVMSRFKLETVRPLLHKSIVELTDDRKLRLHGVLRECKIAMDDLQQCSEDEPSDDMKSLPYSIAKSNAQLAELDIPDDALTDPAQLEAIIKQLHNNIQCNIYSRGEAVESSENDDVSERYNALILDDNYELTNGRVPVQCQYILSGEDRLEFKHNYATAADTRVDHTDDNNTANNKDINLDISAEQVNTTNDPNSNNGTQASRVENTDIKATTNSAVTSSANNINSTSFNSDLSARRLENTDIKATNSDDKENNTDYDNEDLVDNKDAKLINLLDVLNDTNDAILFRNPTGNTDAKLVNLYGSVTNTDTINNDTLGRSRSPVEISFDWNGRQDSLDKVPLLLNECQNSLMNRPKLIGSDISPGSGNLPVFLNSNVNDFSDSILSNQRDGHTQTLQSRGNDRTCSNCHIRNHGHKTDTKITEDTEERPEEHTEQKFPIDLPVFENNLSGDTSTTFYSNVDENVHCDILERQSVESSPDRCLCREGEQVVVRSVEASWNSFSTNSTNSYSQNDNGMLTVPDLQSGGTNDHHEEVGLSSDQSNIPKTSQNGTPSDATHVPNVINDLDHPFSINLRLSLKQNNNNNRKGFTYNDLRGSGESCGSVDDNTAQEM